MTLKIFIVATDEDLAYDAARSGFGWSQLKDARAQLKELSRNVANNKLKLYEVTIDVKEIPNGS